MAFMCIQSSRECDACGACSAKRPALTCDCCGEDIFAGDDYWNLGAYRYCEDCIIAARREAPEFAYEI